MGELRKGARLPAHRDLYWAEQPDTKVRRRTPVAGTAFHLLPLHCLLCPRIWHSLLSMAISAYEGRAK